jgi:hypothetical protein
LVYPSSGGRQLRGFRDAPGGFWQRPDPPRLVAVCLGRRRTMLQLAAHAMQLGAKGRERAGKCSQGATLGGGSSAVESYEVGKLIQESIIQG